MAIKQSCLVFLFLQNKLFTVDPFWVHAFLLFCECVVLEDEVDGDEAGEDDSEDDGDKEVGDQEEAE